MKRVTRVLLTGLVLVAATSAPAARVEETPAERPPDPLEEFVPRERLKADSVVALPVDI